MNSGLIEGRVISATRRCLSREPQAAEEKEKDRNWDVEGRRKTLAS